MSETERPIFSSVGLDNEIHELCDARNFAKAVLMEVPKGSCDYMFYKAQLAGIEERLEELGIDEIEEPLEVNVTYEQDDGLGAIRRRRKIRIGK